MSPECATDPECTTGKDESGAAAVGLLLLLLAAIPAVAADLPPAGRAPSRCRVTITTPRPAALLYGLVDIAAEISCPEGETPATLFFMVDGRVAGQFARPPWRTTWDAGGTFAAHTLEARLVDRSGRIAAATVITPGAALNEAVRVAAMPLDLVELSVAVADAGGAPIRGLTRGDFTVREDGQEKDLAEARAEDRPLSVAVLIDVSSSMRAWWPRVREAAAVMARALGPGDEVKIVAFSGPAFLVQDFTADPERVQRSMDRFQDWGGGTSLYDTLAAVGTEMAWGRAGRQVVVLVTDGIDTLSRIDARRLRGYLRRTDLTVESIAVPARKSDAARAARALSELKRLARETGGDVRPLPVPEAMQDAFAGLTRSLRDRYCLSWHSDRAGREGRRAIEVGVRLPGATVHARTGLIGARPIGAFLIDDLRDGDQATRRKAAEWLATMPVEGGGDALLEALHDRAVEVRATACVSLGKLREPRAIDPLVTLLSDRALEVRLAAADGLRAFGPAAVPDLVDTIEKAPPREQVEILPILADIGDARALDAIERLARPAPVAAWRPGAPPPGTEPRPGPEEVDVRVRAIEALGTMESPTVVPALEKSARDSAAAARAAAVNALAENATPEAFAALDRLDERAALVGGLAMLARRGRLASWLARPDAAAIFLRTAEARPSPASSASLSGPLPPDGSLEDPRPAPDVVAAVGGPRAAAHLLDVAARALPHELATRAAALAAASATQPEPAAGP
jgi:VWFA-related protein